MLLSQRTRVNGGVRIKNYSARVCTSAQIDGDKVMGSCKFVVSSFQCTKSTFCHSIWTVWDKKKSSTTFGVKRGNSASRSVKPLFYSVNLGRITFLQTLRQNFPVLPQKPWKNLFYFFTVLYIYIFFGTVCYPWLFLALVSDNILQSFGQRFCPACTLLKARLLLFVASV